MLSLPMYKSDHYFLNALGVWIVRLFVLLTTGPDDKDESWNSEMGLTKAVISIRIGNLLKCAEQAVAKDFLATGAILFAGFQIAYISSAVASDAVNFELKSKGCWKYSGIASSYQAELDAGSMITVTVSSPRSPIVVGSKLRIQADWNERELIFKVPTTDNYLIAFSPRSELGAKGKVRVCRD